MGLSFFNFHLYGFFIGLGIIFGYLVVLKRANKFEISEKELNKLFFFVVIFGIIGARIYHVLDKWEYYSKNLLQILALWQGGLAIYGGIIGGIAALWIFTINSKSQILNSKQILNSNSLNSKRFLKYLDLVVPGVMIGQAIGRIGNYFNQEAFGPPTNLPWGIFIKLENRPEIWRNYSFFHPTFFYESLWMLLGFFLLLFYERNMHIYSRSRGDMQNLSLKEYDGKIFGLYLVWYGAGRFCLEFLRFDTAKIGMINTAQLISIFAIVFGIYFLRIKGKSFFHCPF